jgi:hypothetical protein
MTRGASRGWFRAGAIGLVVVAVLHSVGHFGPRPTDPEGIALDAAMESYRTPIMGMNPSMTDITKSLSLTMTVLLLLAGALGIVASRAADPALLRRFAILYVAGVSALVALFTVYHLPPPLVSLAVVDIFFLTSILRSPRRAE